MTNNQTINKEVQVRAGVGHLRPAHQKQTCRDSITERFDNSQVVALWLNCFSENQTVEKITGYYPTDKTLVDQ